MTAQHADGGELKRVESYQWPTGHVGHLSANQQSSLTAFKTLCEQNGYYTPATLDGRTPATHDEETLLRYLRARKFLPQEAFKQFKDTEDWRKENQLDRLYETIDVQEYDRTRRVYPQWTGRRDKRGIPLYVYQVSQVDAKDVSAHGKDNKTSRSSSMSTTATGTSGTPDTPPRMLRLFALYENLCRFVLPLCSAMPDRSHAETPISQSNNIVDISKVSMAKFWSLRNHMSEASTLATAHYPETLDRIFVVGAPGFFSTVWGWAKNWFDPITVSKIFILNDKTMLATLEKYIDRDNIPKKYGGNLDWTFGDMPSLEDGIANNLRWKEDIRHKGHRTLPIGPIRWQYDAEGDLVAIAIGSENGKPRSRVLAGLHPDDHVARLALSPGRSEPSLNTRNLAPPTPTTGNLAPSSPQRLALHRVASQAPAPEEGPPVKASSPPLEGAVPTDAVSLPSLEGSTPPTNAAAPTQQAAGESGWAAAVAARAMSGNADLDVGKNAKSHVTQTSREGTYTIPFRDHAEQPNASIPTHANAANTNTAPSAPATETRQGTSHTRLEQQAGTHAAGTMAEGTPRHTIDGQGSKTAIMEPTTVGQAPKEHPVPEAEGGQHPTYLEQAHNLAGQAVEQAKHLPGTVMAAVGYGGKGEHEEEVQQVKRDERRDPEIEGMEKGDVEEFLRSRTMSHKSG
ncbi:hypothetical protein LTR78_002834 [Recurvomyces mirabilis]|uniref:CRAL-TRIO domain-containing protein n=1 Tax=Recurvomyces mirabilis TaxID=574656 RepID=A0AAE0WSL1_9PEZI|nr:hypothetical protein LTR78_002834 [Recurvomyces mirabilis]KAK5159433.1 hypothetical protein LTS14_002575 [Recurvomyces mirabilis]